jgi:NADH dehydrogenase FAD-containing subunit
MKTQIVVIGGGASGLALVARLGASVGGERCDVILVERNHTHVWKPLLHEVAAALDRPELTKRPPDTHKETKQERQAALRKASDRVRSGLNPALFSDMACAAPHT